MWKCQKYILVIVLLLSSAIPNANAIAFQLAARHDERASALLGEWRVRSEVTWSDCNYVPEGKTSKSEISIHNMNGSLYPSWDANEWQLVRNKAIDFQNDDSLHWERDSKLVTSQEYWFVKSINDFTMKRSGLLVGKSYHKQYLNGEYVGSYITKSILTKI